MYDRKNMKVIDREPFIFRIVLVSLFIVVMTLLASETGQSQELCKPP